MVVSIDHAFRRAWNNGTNIFLVSVAKSTNVPGSPEGVINTHNYQAMYYPDGSYAGINEIVFNFKPWLDWYLQTTGQRLVGGSGPFAPASGHGSADATSGASDAGGHGDGGHGDADATSGASN